MLRQRGGTHLENRPVTYIVRRNQKPVQERYEQLLLQYDYLQEEPYIHKREQLFLMVSQGCSDSFIRHFFQDDAGISSQDLDLMRGMAFFAGEDFVLSRFFRKETEEQRVIELFTEAIAQKQEHTPDIAAVLNEIGQRLEQFSLQLESLKQTQEQAKEQYEYLQSGLDQAAPNRFDAWRKQRLIRKAIADPACTAGKLKQILTDEERLTYQQLKERIQEGDRT